MASRVVIVVMILLLKLDKKVSVSNASEIKTEVDSETSPESMKKMDTLSWMHSKLEAMEETLKSMDENMAQLALEVKKNYKIAEAITPIKTDITNAFQEIQSDIFTKMNQSFAQELFSMKEDIKELIEDKSVRDVKESPFNCADIQTFGQTLNGIYTLTISYYTFQVYCDFETDGGGWTVIQRRDDVKPIIDFNKNWPEYRAGFGSLWKDFWLGTHAIQLMTSQANMSLHVDVTSSNGNKKSAHFERFLVQDEENQFHVSVENFNGDSDDCLAWFLGPGFTSRQVGNEVLENLNCGQKLKSGWWFTYCLSCNFQRDFFMNKTGRAVQDPSSWILHKGKEKKYVMRMRPVDFKNHVTGVRGG